jgi:hypothetical protein
MIVKLPSLSVNSIRNSVNVVTMIGVMSRPCQQDELVVYSDADWAGCPDTRKSTSGYVVFLSDYHLMVIQAVSHSSVEAEYCAIAMQSPSIQAMPAS